MNGITLCRQPYRSVSLRGLAFALLCTAAAPSVHAAPPAAPDLPTVLDLALAQHLELDPGWLALLGYRPVLTGEGWESQADRPEFFLAADGAHDPRAELLADLGALFSGAAPAARCRFPARYTWLQQKLAVQPPDDLLDRCPELRAWYAPLAAQAVSIDFASAYLENPSSTFGHTFLRFRRPDTADLLSPTINYAADASHADNKLGFIVKGLVGGFPGVADQLPYFRRLRIYGDNEGRDVWEYGLELDPAQVRMLLFNLWEVKDGIYDYYFLDENCSYRTLALIAAAAPERDLLRPFWLDVVPVETIKVLRRRGLVGDPGYHPSSIRTLYWHTRDFSDSELRLVAALARGEQRPDQLPLPAQRRAAVLQAAAEYAAILINRGQLDLETRDRVVHALILERLRLEPPPPDPVPPPPPPEAAHGGRVFSAGWIDRQGAQGLELGYAGFQHQLVDPLAGYQPGAAVSVLGLRYRFGEAGTRGLERLDLLRVESDTPSTRLFRQPAWDLLLGLERKDVGAGRPLLGSLSYDTGGAVNTPAGVLSLRLGGSLDAAPVLRAGAGLEGRLMLDLTRQTQRFSYQLYYEQARYLLGEDSHRHDYGLRLGLPLARELELELEAQRAGALATDSQLGLELRKFF